MAASGVSGLWSIVAAAALAGCATGEREAPAMAGAVVEYEVPWPGEALPHHASAAHEGGGGHAGSTHELAFEPGGKGLWISGQSWDAIARFDLATATFQVFPMGEGSRPHGLAFNGDGRLWATLEYAGAVVAIDPETGRIVERRDVHIACAACAAPLNPHPHGLAIGADGRTLWFTGKATGTIGRIDPDGRTTHFQLGAPGATPIYIRAEGGTGAARPMWATELTGNVIARIAGGGEEIAEYPIPTPNSRPIAIAPGPDGAMWFSEEAGNRIGRIDPACRGDTPEARKACVHEFAIPKRQPNMILAALAFDAAGNLWVQQYVDPNAPAPAGTDFVIRIDGTALRKASAASAAPLPEEAFTFLAVPTRGTVMHRIVERPDGAMWFSEMGTDRIGVVRR
jgi:virginiamycin B lyase